MTSEEIIDKYVDALRLAATIKKMAVGDVGNAEIDTQILVSIANTIYGDM